MLISRGLGNRPAAAFGTRQLPLLVLLLLLLLLLSHLLRMHVLLSTHKAVSSATTSPHRHSCDRSLFGDIYSF
jgi:hypothetical protein